MIICDDVLHWAETYQGEKFHAMVCDPPYHLTELASLHSGMVGQRNEEEKAYRRTGSRGFMGARWDGLDTDGRGIAFRPETWAALARHLLPGAFVMAFASSRGWHRLACAMEDAGLVIHPSIFNYRTGETLDIGMYGWSAGSGFPKSTKIDTQVDKAAGMEQEVLGPRTHADGRTRATEPWAQKSYKNVRIRQNEIPTALSGLERMPATPLAQTWAGHRYGLQALKPALEPLILAQKRLNDCTVYDKLIRESTIFLEGFLCQFINATAVKNSLHEVGLRPNEVAENSAHASAFLLRYVLSHGATSGTMGMWQSPEAGLTILNIASLWNSILDALFSQGNSSTTKTATAATTALTILKSWLWQNTAASIMQAVCHQNGVSLSVMVAGENLNDSSVSPPPTQKPTAPETVFENIKDGADSAPVLAVDNPMSSHTSVCRQPDVIALLNAITEQAEHGQTPSEELKYLAKSAESLIIAASSDLLALHATSAQSRASGKAVLSPIIVAQVPYSGRSVDSITQHGAGALNIEGGRIGTARNVPASLSQCKNPHGDYGPRHRGSAHELDGQIGRWPPNLALCHTPRCRPLGTRQVQGTNPPGPGAGSASRQSAYGLGARPVQDYASPDGTETVLAWDCAEGCPVAALDGQAGYRDAGGQSDKPGTSPKTQDIYGDYACSERTVSYHDSGNASRFFHVSDWSLEVAEQLAQADPVRYEAKSSRSERDAGLAGLPRQANDWQRETCGLNQDRPNREGRAPAVPPRNNHPCVKPISLTKWLCSLLLPPAAYAPRRILIPFAGSGSEGIGALLAGWEEIVMIEQSAEYCAMAEKRLEWWRTQEQPSLWPGAGLETKKPVAVTKLDATLPLFPLD